MMWVSLLFFSLVSFSQVETDCAQVRNDPRALLIYRVVDPVGEDALGDVALWRSFKWKFLEKIPALWGDRKAIESNNEIRKLSKADKEKILQCFQGSDFQLTSQEKNHLVEKIPLLDPNDYSIPVEAIEEIENKEAFTTVMKVFTELNQQKKKAYAYITCAEETKGLNDKKDPLKDKEFNEMFRTTICRTGIKPLVGQEHEWTNKFKIKPPFSKLLVALANGDTARILPTGQEDKLMEWALNRPERSITIHEIFEHSYRLNGGDVYKTFLTVENVLSENFYLGPLRENSLLATKLGKIINHSGGSFDLYGPWYHLYGMMLYGFAEGSGIKATIIGKIETGTSLFFHEFNDHQENHMIDGGKIGARLKRRIKKIKTNKDFAEYCLGAKAEVQLQDYLNIEQMKEEKLIQSVSEIFLQPLK
jgi:hypothetical protein